MRVRGAALFSQFLCMAGLASCATEVGAGAGAGAGGAVAVQAPPPTHLPTAVEPFPCLRPDACDPRAKYRRLDASCNNLRIPTWGMSGSPFARVLRSSYADVYIQFSYRLVLRLIHCSSCVCSQFAQVNHPVSAGVWAPRRAKDGSELPNARLVRTTLLEDREVDDPRHTLLLMQFGQLIAHDSALGPQDCILSPAYHGERFTCCSPDDTVTPDLPKECLSVPLPENDTFFGPLGKRCMPIVRTQNTHSNGCTRSAGEQISLVNHLLDVSFVYGNNKNQADALRTFQGGTLKVQKMGNREFLPNTNNPKDQCFLPTKAENTCYKAGDFRVNVVPQIAVLQILFLRVHNKLAQKLSELNPHWDDETLYQEARRILIGQYQHIIYNEFLPVIVGAEFMAKHFLKPSASGLVDFYDEDLNPATLSSFTSSTFRGLHSLIQGKVQLQNSERKPEREIILSEWFNRPSIIQENTQNFDFLLLGLVSQSSQKYDNHHTKQVSDLLFRGHKDFGVDLLTTDIVRNRDYGLASYIAFQKLCKVGNITTHDDLTAIMKREDVEKLKRVYKHPDDIDLTVGGLLERPKPGALVGPTFQCLIGDQFIRWKMGDRFFYEFRGFEHSFTTVQVNEIKKSTFSRLICDHGDEINTMQPLAFLKVSDKNPLTSCNSSIIPKPDFSAWKDTK
ncbi:Peroxidase [Gryllus bimaculatus]|nr:Peroxidase [Gryllus bimaculatus]